MPCPFYQPVERGVRLGHNAIGQRGVNRQLAPCAEENQPRDTLRPVQRHLLRDCAAHAVPDKNRPVDGQRVEQRDDIPPVRVDRVASRRGGFAVAG